MGCSFKLFLLLEYGKWTDLVTFAICFRRRQAGVFATLSKSLLALIELAKVIWVDYSQSTRLYCNRLYRDRRDRAPDVVLLISLVL